MIESQTIGLPVICYDLSKVAVTNPEDLNEKAVSRVVFPAKAQRAEVEAKNLNFKQDGIPAYYLRLSAYYNLSQEEFDAILREALLRSKSLKLPKAQYDTRLREAWTLEDFYAESSLPSFWHSKSTITAYATTINSDNVRMLGANHQSHRAQVELDKNIMIIEAEGNYKQNFREITEDFKPQLATVRLSKQDAEKIVELSQRTAIGQLLSSHLKKQLEPKSYMALRVGIGTGIALDTQEVIEVTVRTSQLPLIERQLHIDLFNPKIDQESQVVRLSKVYSLIGLLRNRRLEDMKRMAKTLDGIAFSSYGNYAISEQQAKELLDKELRLLQDFYGDDIRYMLSFGGNIHIFRGNVVKRLANELLGSEVIEKLQELNLEDYVNFLISQGYTREYFEERPYLPAYSVKERHLLEFYKQIYLQDPAKAAKIYRNGYLNTRQSVSIESDIREDGSKTQRIEIAPKAKVYAFEIKQPIFAEGSNDFSFGKIIPSSDDAHLWVRSSLSGSELLPIQEWTCNKVGITFIQ